MIGAVGSCLSAAVAAVALTSLTQMLMPEGSVRRIGGVVGGMLVLIVVLRGAGGIDLNALTLQIDAHEETIRQVSEQWEADRERQLASIIEERTATYISDKASSLGVRVSVRVETEKNGEGLTVPYRAILTGEYSAALAQVIETELGITPERQVWNES